MAKKVKTWLTDDMEAAGGREVVADQTVEFSLDGHDYEIDLSAKNATKLRNEIEQWTQHARQTGGRKRTKRVITTAPKPSVPGDDMDTEQRRACREWLRNNTEEWKNIGSRGRIPTEALAVFHSRSVGPEFSAAV